MSGTFTATALIQTTNSPDADRLEISLADASGRTQTLTLSAELSAALSDVLRDFAAKAVTPTGAPTKRPEGFAVGSGKYESVVLVRFEDDAPYGLAPRDAAVLGQALLEEAESLCRRPSLVLQ